MSETVLQIPLEKIVTHPENRRVGGFDPVKLQQLADSSRDIAVAENIRLTGLLREEHSHNKDWDVRARRELEAGKAAGQ